MQGINQRDVWQNRSPSARDMVVTEFRHQPTKLDLRSYISARYKLTVYRDQEDGERFDLEQDPDERHHLWNDPAGANLQAEMLRKSLNAEILREPTRLPRIAHA